MRWLRVFMFIVLVVAVVGPAVGDVADAQCAAVVNRIEEDGPVPVVYNGSWTPGLTRTWSGGTARYTATACGRVTFSFRGTSVAWYGWRGPAGGQARVYLDGVLVETVDTFASNEQPVPLVVWSRGGLAQGPHTLVIEAVTTGPDVFVDAFEVDSARIEENGTEHLTYTDPNTATGTWNQAEPRPWSNGKAIYSNSLDAVATLSFAGTAVSWYGWRGPFGGRARVFVDGVEVQPPLDTCALTEQPVPLVVFTRTGLASGVHTLRIQPIGLAPGSPCTDGIVVVDAFDVTR